MLEKKVIIKGKSGLHARPAAYFVKVANKFDSEIWIKKDEKKVSAKSIIGVLSLGIGQGMEVIIEAQGKDEAEAINELETLINEEATVE